MAVEWRKCNKLSWALCDGNCSGCNTVSTSFTINPPSPSIKHGLSSVGNPHEADINEAIIVALTIERFKELEEELKKNAIEEFKKKLIDKLLNEEI